MNLLHLGPNYTGYRLFAHKIFDVRFSPWIYSIWAPNTWTKAFLHIIAKIAELLAIVVIPSSHNDYAGSEKNFIVKKFLYSYMNSSSRMVLVT